MKRGLLLLCFLLLATVQAAAQETPSLESLLPAGDATAAGRMVQLIVAVTVLSVAPGLLIMVTCFTRFVIALFDVTPSLCEDDDEIEVVLFVIVK